MRSSEKTAMSSKKFVAYMISEIGWKALFILILLNTEMSMISCILMMTIVIISGFVQVGYIIGQAALDRYTRVAQISAGMISGSGSEDEIVKENGTPTEKTEEKTTKREEDE